VRGPLIGHRAPVDSFALITRSGGGARLEVVSDFGTAAAVVGFRTISRFWLSNTY